jgi:hypothetical protein
MKRHLAPLPAILSLLLLAGCDQPPAKEIAAAETALAQARKGGAFAFAPEQWKAAEAALAQARQKVEMKDYRGALSSAIDASDKAKGAATAAASAKLLARSAAEVAQAEAQAALDEVAAVKEEAAKAKVPDSAFGDLEPKLEAARQAMALVTESLDKGDLLGAQKAGADLKALATPLAQASRDALAAWQQAHPKGKKGAKAAPPRKP